MTKHEEIIRYIYKLEVGTKISVRSVANSLKVSDGTAYRAIKDAESMGLVSTVPRIGTVRIEKVEKKNIETLTYAEVINIVDGSALGGRDGLYKTLNKFVIGAMTVDEMKKYLSEGSLLIVGNREEAQRLAIENECAVLITGGFNCSEEIKALANKKKLPIMSCSYDTFTTATMINRAISENLIKKDIILVEDIMKTNLAVLNANSTVGDARELVQSSNHGKLPVIDENNKVIGLVTLKDITADAFDDESITNYMIKNPVTIGVKTSVAYAAHIMAWEGIELIPIIESKQLAGVISRQDVIKALQYVNNQPQVGETMDDILLRGFKRTNTNSGIKFTGKIIPEMLNPIGTASWSALSMLMQTCGTLALNQKNHTNVAVDSFSIIFVKPIQVDSKVTINADFIDTSRGFSKVEIVIYNEKDQEPVAKALLSGKIFRK